MQTATKPTTKQSFIEALRSGNYEQLTDGRMFCEQTGAVCANMVFSLINDDPNLDAPIGNDFVGHIPVQVFNRIAELNDGGYSFNEIADLLEQHGNNDLTSFSY